MISDLIRKLISLLSFFYVNKKINKKQNKKILGEIRYKLKEKETNISTLKKTHISFNKKLKLLLIGNRIDNFLREGFIQKMFFLHNRLFVFKELRVLKKSKKWNFYKKIINENHIGNPIRYFLYPTSAGNRINHVYHLSILDNEFGIELKKIRKVFEFGSGYGCMASIFSRISKNIKYSCFDTFHVNLLQYYYLKHNKLNVGFNEKKNNIILRSNIKNISLYHKKNSNYLFIANWSLSETPLKFRRNFEKIIKESKYILICFQETFEEINNLKYFNLLKKTLHNFEVRILENNFYKGNFFNKQNHYFFIAKKL